MGAAPRRRRWPRVPRRLSAAAGRRAAGVGRRLRRLALRGRRVRRSSSQPVLLVVQSADDGGPLSLLTGSYGLRWAAHAAVGLLALPVALAPASARRSLAGGRAAAGVGAHPVAAGARRQRAGRWSWRSTPLTSRRRCIWAGVVTALVLAVLSLRRSGGRSDLRALVLADRAASPRSAWPSSPSPASRCRGAASPPWTRCWSPPTGGSCSSSSRWWPWSWPSPRWCGARSAPASSAIPVLRVEALVLLAVLAVGGRRRRLPARARHPVDASVAGPAHRVGPGGRRRPDPRRRAEPPGPELRDGRRVPDPAARPRRDPAGQRHVRGPGCAERPPTCGPRATADGYWRPTSIDTPGTWHVSVRVERANVRRVDGRLRLDRGRPSGAARRPRRLVRAAAARAPTPAPLAGTVAALALVGAAAVRRRRGRADLSADAGPPRPRAGWGAGGREHRAGSRGTTPGMPCVPEGMGPLASSEAKGRTHDRASCRRLLVRPRLPLGMDDVALDARGREGAPRRRPVARHEPGGPQRGQGPARGLPRADGPLLGAGARRRSPPRSSTGTTSCSRSTPRWARGSIPAA